MSGTGDQLLDQFQAFPGSVDFFRIGAHAPISVRDQVVRAGFLIQRLWVTSRLQARTKLLIVGAGASGVAAAISALNFGVETVTLVEVSDGPLSLQANCTTRFLDPVQYDWPASYWDAKTWPLPEPLKPHSTCFIMKSPVTLQAKTADLLAIDFKNALLNYEASGRADTRYSHRFLEASKQPGGHYEADIVPRNGTNPLRLETDLIVFAGGMGQERVTLPRTNGGPVFESPYFWDEDSFETPSFLANAQHPVVVSGAGDGALQDFIRLFTGQSSARAVWHHVLNALPKPSPALDAINSLWHWDDHARRLAAFAPGALKRGELSKQLQSRYHDAVNTLFAAHQSEVTAALSQLIGHRDCHKVKLMIMDNYFEGCYPLNRLVTLVLIAYCVPAGYPDPVMRNRAIIAVEDAAGGVLAKVATPTYGHTTTAELAAWTGTVLTEHFGTVIVRHGIDTTKTTMPVDRLLQQILPLHLA